MSKRLNFSLAITFTSFYLAIICAFLHNFVSGLLGREEPFFFTLTMISALVFPFAFVCSSVIWLRTLRQERKEVK